MSFDNLNEIASVASKIQTRRFIITVVISVFSLIAAITAAVAALIPLI